MKDSEIIIRNAKQDDAEALLEIYAPYVKKTAITFEWEVPSVDDFRNRIKNISSKYPYIVAEKNGMIVGYAYANTFRGRKAYSWTAESSIYVKEDFRGKGIGRILVSNLEQRLADQHVLNLYAVIASIENEDEYLTNDSVRFHTKMGYTNPCIFNKCGYKFNRWYDTTTMEKFLGPHTADPEPAIKEEISLPSLEKIHQKYRLLTLFLVKNTISITAMESCTSGFIASLITDTEGSSAIMKGSFVTYSNEMKIQNGVDEKIITENGVYSLKTAQEMAEACCRKIPADISIGVTGSFGNVDPANADSVPGKVFIAVKIKDEMITSELTLPVNITRFQSKLCTADKVFELINSRLSVL